MREVLLRMVANEKASSLATLVATSSSGSAVAGGVSPGAGSLVGCSATGSAGSQVEQNMLRLANSSPSLLRCSTGAFGLRGRWRTAAGADLASPSSSASTRWFDALAANTAHTITTRKFSTQKYFLR